MKKSVFFSAKIPKFAKQIFFPLFFTRFHQFHLQFFFSKFFLLKFQNLQDFGNT